MKRIFTIAIIGLVMISLSGCDDLLEEDLSGHGVILLTPPEGHVTSSNIVEFRWEAVPLALAYRFQIATPDFDNAVLYLHDSLITSTTFVIELSPGEYEWRIRAENPNSHTDYYSRSLTVTEAASLEDLTPVLSSPPSPYVTNSDSIIFTWQALSGADDYRFELRSGDQSGELINAQIVDGVTTSIGSLDEGSFTWGVQAQNSTSTSGFTYRTFIIDRTAPSEPALVAPANAAVLPNTPIIFQWQSGSDPNVLAGDSVFIMDNNDTFIREILANTTTFEDSLGLGNYSWFVRTIDAAGNGTSSDLRTFTVQ